MIRTYLKLAWRNIRIHKFNSLLNIAGLAVGICFTILIMSYIWGEWQVNKSLKDHERQYIVQSRWKDPNMGLDITTVGPLVKQLRESYPQLVSDYYRWDGVTSNVSNGTRVFREGLQLGDSSFLKMYGFKVLYGSPDHALTDPFTIVITEDAAVKYFGRVNVVGEDLSIESFSGSKHAFKINAVLESIPYTSINRVTFDNNNQIFVSQASIGYFNRSIESWDNAYIVGFVRLQLGVHPADLLLPMKRILHQYGTPVIAANMQPYLVALDDFYLTQNGNSVKNMLYTVSCIALFILLMAIVNFINLSIGNAGSRLKEIGIRKVMGSIRRQIIFQFLTESVLIVACAMAFALIMFHVFQPFASDILGKSIPGLRSFPIYFLWIPVVLTILIGLLAGVYPALILSGLKVVDLTKGKIKSVRSGILFRKTLVGFQFFTASVVLIGAVILGKQIALFFSARLGYDKDYVVSIQLPRDWTEKGVKHMQAIRDEFGRMPEVEKASLTWSVPDGTGIGTNMLYPQGKDSTQATPYESLIADEQYLDALHIPLVAGRTFYGPADSLNIVINETAAKQLGFEQPQNALGTKLYASATSPFTIIGITHDFHYSSMRNPIRPFLISHVSLNKVYRLLCFRLKPGNIASSINAIQTKWSQLLPGTAFDYKFMNETLERVYRTEMQLKKASQVGTVLTIFIVALGITGLVSLSIQKRAKEIGIRKVLGASISNITALFFGDFMPVILTSSLLAIPAAWYIMDHWLQDFSYRITIGVFPFLIAILSLSSITIVLIGLQTWKLAATKPAQTLKNE